MIERFRRGELEFALWALKANKKSAPQMPSEFGTRIRRLLEIDRSDDFVEAASAFHAFSTDGPGGRGHDVVFSLLDLQMLWLGLELVEMGFKQREVVTQLRFARPILAKTFGVDLSGVWESEQPQFLALPGVERADFDWLRPPRPFVTSADELAQRLSAGDFDKLALVQLGWSHRRGVEVLQLPAPTRRKSIKSE